MNVSVITETRTEIESRLCLYSTYDLSLRRRRHDGVVLPHGVLFRGAAEGTIRKYLIEEKNYLDAVIGLPANLFFGTSIPTCVLVFKKCRQADDDVVFIDASQSFEKGKIKTISQMKM